MPKRWIIGGMWAALVSAGIWTFDRNAAAEQPTKPRKIIISDVIITGNPQMSSEQIKARLHTQSNKAYNPVVVNADVRELYKTGEFRSITTWLEPDGIDHAKIYFDVREMFNMVQKLTFLGNKHIKDKDLEEATGVRPSTPLNPNLNRQGCQKILDKYAEMGRLFADCQLVKGGDLADTEVVYQITEGPKVKVHDVQFTGNTFATAAQLRQKVHLRVGSTYNREMAEAGINEIYDIYSDAGYRDVRISLEIQRDPSPSEITMIYHIHEGPRYRIADDSQDY
jgi:outer membrane protein insertion porin family